MPKLKKFDVGLRSTETKKLVEDAKGKGMHPHALIAQIVREKYGVEEA